MRQAWRTDGHEQPSVPRLANAVAALRAAEYRGESHPNVLRLSAEVIRTRKALTVDQATAAGAYLPDDVLRDLARDDQLLRERDDTGLSLSRLRLEITRRPCQNNEDRSKTPVHEAGRRRPQSRVMAARLRARWAGGGGG